MSTLPIRLRLTAAFALAMLAVLAAAGAVVYFTVRSELNESIASTLRARADAVAATVGEPTELATGAALLDPDETFAQVVSPTGALLDAAGGAGEPALDAGRLRAARTGPVMFDAEVAGIESSARVLARPAGPSSSSPVVVVGQTLEDRDETLSGLLATFGIGGPIAIALASLVGYGLAAAGLGPVEAMRRRATEVSLEDDESLPLPAADDEIRRLGETLNQMLERLRVSFERERRFVADASHELRTPISVIKAELEAALHDGAYGEEVGNALRSALEECDHLIQLAEDLLILARSSDGSLPLRPECLDAAELLAGVRDRFSYRAGQQERTISVAAQQGLQLEADPLRLRQAIGNLLDNALRHGEGTVALVARRAGDHVELSVADEGPGFEPEIVHAAFDRFTRGDTARTRGGAGLGLAIVKSIVEAHGGTVSVSPGARPEVQVRLPTRALP